MLQRRESRHTTTKGAVRVTRRRRGSRRDAVRQRLRPGCPRHCSGHRTAQRAMHTYHTGRCAAEPVGQGRWSGCARTVDASGMRSSAMCAVPQTLPGLQVEWSASACATGEWCAPVNRCGRPPWIVQGASLTAVERATAAQRPLQTTAAWIGRAFAAPSLPRTP